MNICVFCSASDVDKQYTDDAAEFAALIGKGGHTLVWGGTRFGTMNVVASTVQRNGGTIIGVASERLRPRLYEGADELVVEKTLMERKATMLKRSDAFVVMPGGIGTLDEITEILELKKHHVHDKPVVILNSGGFYDGFKIQLERMEAEGFLPRPMSEMLCIAQTPDAAMRYLESYKVID